ncbi:hypothetical protein FRC09_008363 [Ceratobasidium sp. 395]|nr:hypothetical protein FRC09_008363 [Ceratobasidium sp. 395]
MGLEGGAASSESNVLTSRWRTQLFALQCLHDICTLVAQSGRREHIDIPFAKQHGIATGNLLVTRVPDLIKMAFTASAAYVTEIRLEGLTVLRDVIQIFARAPDPDYEQSLLLEQHQAPITAALTPAFSGDSTPDVLATAIQVCAVFVGSGLVRDINRMGRILKLLTSALEQKPGLLSIGDVAQLGPNASVMLRVSTLTAWAELEVASAREEYLQAVLKPYRGTLCFLWVSALRDYASIRADSEVQQDNTSGMDTSYTGLGRETLLPYYAESWSKILAAVGCAMKANDPHLIQAMDGHDPATAAAPTNRGVRREPTECFFVILGLVYESLSAVSSDSAATPESQAVALTSIQVLAYLTRPEYAGQAILDPPIFEELIALWYRMSMTEPWEIQTYLVAAVASLVRSQQTHMRVSTDGSGVIGGETPIAQCLRICVTILKNAIPSPQAQSNSIQQNPAGRVPLIISAFQALLAIGEIAGPSAQPDIRAIGLSIYADLLKDEYSELDIVGPTLPALRGLLLSDAKAVAKEEIYPRLVHGLLSACLQNIDDMSGRASKTAILKTKNNLLAAVLILTVSPVELKLSRAAVEHCCFLISQKLLETSEISLAAAQCLKTLMTVSPNNSAMQYAASMLLPSAITFIVNCAAEDDAGQAACLPTLEEILRATNILCTQTPEEHRSRMFGALMPPISSLLGGGDGGTSPMHVAAISQILSFATLSPAAFRECASLMKQDQRDLMETSIRQAVAEREKSTAHTSTSKPQIALRAF